VSPNTLKMASQAKEKIRTRYQQLFQRLEEAAVTKDDLNSTALNNVVESSSGKKKWLLFRKKSKKRTPVSQVGDVSQSITDKDSRYGSESDLVISHLPDNAVAPVVKRSQSQNPISTITVTDYDSGSSSPKVHFINTKMHYGAEHCHSSSISSASSIQNTSQLQESPSFRLLSPKGITTNSFRPSASPSPLPSPGTTPVISIRKNSAASSPGALTLPGSLEHPDTDDSGEKRSAAFLSRTNMIRLREKFRASMRRSDSTESMQVILISSLAFFLCRRNISQRLIYLN
jgi:hypothetical protein